MLVHEAVTFIRLRWLAAGVLILTSILFALKNMDFEVFLVAGVYVFSYNILLSELKSKGIYLQIFLDWIAIAVIGYYTGGIKSPVIYLFIFHIVITSLLLTTMEHIVFTTLAGLTVFAFYLKDGGSILLDAAFPVFMFFVTGFLSGRIARKLKKIYKELEAAYSRLKEIDREKSDFYIRVAHSLKAPLATASTLINEVLYRKVYDQDVLQRALTKLTNAMNMIKDLLRLEDIPRDIVEVDVVDAFFNIIRDRNSTIKSKNLRVVFNSTPIEKIKGDYDDWIIIAENLIDNAIKYTPQNGSIRVEVMRLNGFIVVRVEDTGIGIPPDELNRVGEEFFRASNAANYTENGTGLGVAIVKKLVRKMNGSIDIVSAPGKGTKVTLKIPYA